GHRGLAQRRDGRAVGGPALRGGSQPGDGAAVLPRAPGGPGNPPGRQPGPPVAGGRRGWFPARGRLPSGPGAVTPCGQPGTETFAAHPTPHGMGWGPAGANTTTAGTPTPTLQVNFETSRIRFHVRSFSAQHQDEAGDCVCHLSRGSSSFLPPASATGPSTP